MKVWNLTPHNIDIFSQKQFINLTAKGPTVLNADSVEGQSLATYPSMGEARIDTKTNAIESDLPGLTVTTVYGEATGIPNDVEPNDILIVSLPMQSMAAAAGHPLAGQMVSPYKVVRSSENGSLVLGCMGLSFQPKPKPLYPKFENMAQ